MEPRMTKKDWEAILTALAAISAGEWDYDEPRPDFEKVMVKVRKFIED